MKMKFLPVLTLVAFLLLNNGRLHSQSHAIPGQVIVQLDPSVSADVFLQILANQRTNLPLFEHDKVLSKRHNMHLLQFDPEGWAINDIIDALYDQPQLLAAQWNAAIQKRRLPNDDNYDRQWGFEKIGLPEVWNITTGGVTARGDTIVVAVLDTGFELEHEDLLPNLWRNGGEIPNDGIDNDQNGYVDDMTGWNFRDDSPTPVRDDHGLSVMGILGAKGNNEIGVTGVNWNIKMIPLTIEFVSDIIEAYDYVLELRRKYNESMGVEGAFVVATNASFGVGRTRCNEQPIWGGMYDLMGDEGILTGVGSDNDEYNVDTFGDMPTTCPSDFIITTLNTTEEDEKFQFCSWGSKSVDLGAPGHLSYTLDLDDSYITFNGTSASAPHLTGTIALLYSLPCDTLAEQALTNPKETALSIRNIILESVDELDMLRDLTVTSGRLNAFKAMELAQLSCGGSVGTLDVMQLSPNPVQSLLTIEYETPSFNDFTLRIVNTLGQELFRRTFAPPRFGLKQQEVDVSWLSPGLYYVVLDKGLNISAKPFVKQ
ncbi:MAG: S8 family serine peptidase [Bacteroidota bacterium]